MESAHSDLRANRLLALLDDATLRPLAAHLEPVPLACRETLYEERKPMTHAWFPASGVISVLGASTADESPVEVATIGYEGMLGLAVFLGAQDSPGLVFVQVEGRGWRMPAQALRDCIEAQPAFRHVLQRYAHALMVQISQGTACNRMHSVEQRCARWLLQTHDRVRGNAFDLTQEFLGHMLGERRATVNQVATTLQERGLIRYTRGRIEVRDRAGLEQAACACYGFVQEEFARVLQRAPAQPPAP
jgi:CRP-like cAMP-binding protein